MDGNGRWSQWVEDFKPGGASGTHLLLAAGLWGAVGTALLTVGTLWIAEIGGTAAALWLIAAVFAGGVKSRLVLDRAALKIGARIERRGDGRCLGGFLSPASWGMVFLMMVGGRLLRSGVLPHPVVGPIYTAVGTALVISSGVLWWRRSRAPRQRPTGLQAIEPMTDNAGPKPRIAVEDQA